MKLRAMRSRMRKDDSAVLNLGPILSIAAIIIGAVVALVLIAALLPTYLGAGADVVEAFNNDTTTTGDATADSLLPIFGLITAFAVLFAIVGLVFLSVRLRGR
jgi:hypothetical protein